MNDPRLTATMGKLRHLLTRWEDEHDPPRRAMLAEEIDALEVEAERLRRDALAVLVDGRGHEREMPR